MFKSSKNSVFFVAIIQCVVHNSFATKKCCGEDQYYNLTSSECENTGEKVNFSEILQNFLERFKVRSNVSEICLDQTESGKFVTITNENRDEFFGVSYCFPNADLSKQKVNENHMILRNIKFNGSDPFRCNEELIVSKQKNIRVLRGREVEGGYSTVSSNYSIQQKLRGSGAAFYMKCCGEGEVWNGNFEDGLECVKSENTTHPLFYGLTALHAPIDLAKCRESEFVGISERTKFAILPNTNLILPDEPCSGSYSVYCVERLQSSDGTEQEIALVCPAEETTDVPVLLYPWFYLVTLPFLFATLVVHLILPELQNKHGKLVIGHVLSLFIFFVLMFAVSRATDPSHEACVVLGAATHFFYLSSFAWLTMKGLHLMTIWSISFQHSNFNRSLVFCLFGWGVPAIIVAFALTVQFAYPESGLPYPGYGVRFCFLDKCGADRPSLWYLYVPLGVFILINIIAFFISATLMCEGGFKAKKMVPSKSNLLRSRLLDVVRISIVMGLAWTFDLVSYLAANNSSVWIVIDLLNILTAIYIFYFYICKKRVAGFLADRHPKMFPCFARYGKRANFVLHNSGQQRKISDGVTSFISSDTSGKV